MKVALFLTVKTDRKERGDMQAAGSAVQRVVVSSFHESREIKEKNIINLQHQFE